MSTKNKSVKSKAIEEMKAIKAAIQTESRDTIKSLLIDAAKDTLRESIADDDCVIIEGKKAQKGNDSKGVDEDQDVDSQYQPEDGEDAQSETEEEPAETSQEPEVNDGGNEDADNTPVEDGDNEGTVDVEKYQVNGDPNTLDLTGEEDTESLMKVYKLLSPDDNVVISNNKDGSIELKDKETGAEYLIKSNGENPEDSKTGEEDSEIPEDMDQLAEDFEFEIEHDPENDDEIDGWDETEDENEIAGLPSEENEDEFDFGEEGDTTNDGDEESEKDYTDWDEDDMPYDRFADQTDDLNDSERENGLNESKNRKKNKKNMKKEKIYEVDLGYTDNYQDEDPIEGLSNDGESDFDAGVPKGTKKPWSSLKQKQDPYVNEEDEAETTETEPEQTETEETVVDEAATSKSKRDKRHTTKTRTVGSKEHNPQVTKVNVDETLERIKKENKELKKALVGFKKDLQEAYLTNFNVGRIARLLFENHVTQQEKINIVNRFETEAKTIEQAKMLYESINKELKSAPVKVPMTENVISTSKSQVNETKIYESKSLQETRDFMKRLMNC